MKLILITHKYLYHLILKEKRKIMHYTKIIRIFPSALAKYFKKAFLFKKVNNVQRENV